ncbi:uncharacterized protein LOC135496118 [Lineus longissimus]|uniref:uncharacterized protein LOC135496118 n=1 Tax=Lineus longissimus TaxID=88925 RepID=UPI00315D283C
MLREAVAVDGDANRWETIAAALNTWVKEKKKTKEVVDHFGMLTARCVKERCERLVKMFKKEELDSIKSSGTAEEYDERKQLLGEMVTMADEREAAKALQAVTDAPSKDEKKNSWKKPEKRFGKLQQRAKPKGISRSTGLMVVYNMANYLPISPLKPRGRGGEPSRSCQCAKRRSTTSLTDYLAEKLGQDAEIKNEETKLKKEELELKKEELKLQAAKFQMERKEREQRLEMEKEEKQVYMQMMRDCLAKK